MKTVSIGITLLAFAPIAMMDLAEKNTLTFHVMFFRQFGHV
jgi:hypothetical protein